MHGRHPYEAGDNLKAFMQQLRGRRTETVGRRCVLHCREVEIGKNDVIRPYELPLEFNNIEFRDWALTEGGGRCHSAQGRGS
jgi:hypothetical protein